MFIGYVFLKNLVWTQELAPGAWKIEFLVENYVIVLFPGLNSQIQVKIP